MKKLICLVVAVLIATASTGCISWPKADTVQIESDTPIDLSNLVPNPDDLQYFDTIDEAVAHNDLEMTITYIDERIKLFENDEYAVLYFKANLSGNDVVYALKFMVKVIGETFHYSSPVMGTIMSWDAHKLSVKRMKLDEIGEVRLCISRDSLGLYRIDDTKNFFWGLSQTEKARSLKIEGQLATEVIEVELDGETGYFWYFDDLKTDKRPMFKDVREYTDGEFIITMD